MIQQNPWFGSGLRHCKCVRNIVIDDGEGHSTVTCSGCKLISHRLRRAFEALARPRVIDRQNPARIMRRTGAFADHGLPNGSLLIRSQPALRAGIPYAEGRGAVEFEPTDSASDKALYVYRLLVHDKIITPMPEDQVGEKTVRFRV